MDSISDFPSIFDWMLPEEINFRKNFKEYLYKASCEGYLPVKEIDTIKVFNNGETSVVCLITGEGIEFVTKMSRSSVAIEAEECFLKSWLELGVKVPEILKLHKANEVLPVSILSLEYVKSELLSEKYSDNERLKNGLAREMGRILAKMHKAKGVGFGYPSSGNPKRGQNDSFLKSIDESLLGNRLYWLLDMKVVDKEFLKTVDQSALLLNSDFENGLKPSLVHNDFLPYNIFATNPITVYDPNPRITHPALCLALTLLKTEINNSNQEESLEILSGYRDIADISDDILKAAFIVRGLALLYTWVKKGKTEKTGRLIDLLNCYRK